ncbi:MAG: GNAT family N-acetyltransferase [Tatlockia sp.]|nr:GNAT family N-acetyltransferase [Tatlockia sp.]
MKLIKAQPIHAKQIIPYLSMTCYWKEFIEGNTLNQTYESFMLEWIVHPRLPFINVLVQDNDDQQIFGCVIAATTEDLSTMPDYTPYLHHRVMEAFNPWFQFPVSQGVVLELFALDKELRGQGYGTLLYDVAEKLAKEKNKDTISCFVWSGFRDSLITFTKKGLMIMDCIKFIDPIKMPLLYLEKKSEYVKMKDYFQSSEYINAENMLLD